MLDEKKVQLMTRLAFYEQTQGKEDFKVSAYYRKDYAGIHTIYSVLWITIGYVCVAGLLVLAGLDQLMSHMSNSLILILAVIAVVGYFVLVIGYAAVANHVFNKKHRAARQRVKMYNHDLIKLLKIYEKERR